MMLEKVIKDLSETPPRIMYGDVAQVTNGKAKINVAGSQVSGVNLFCEAKQGDRVVLISDNNRLFALGCTPGVYEIESGKFSNSDTKGFWRKYSDGTAEAYVTRTCKLSATQSWGSAFYTGAEAGIAYGITFIEPPFITSSYQHETSQFTGLVFDNLHATSRTSKFYLVRPTRAETCTVHVTIHAVGRWKT